MYNILLVSSTTAFKNSTTLVNSPAGTTETSKEYAHIKHQAIYLINIIYVDGLADGQQLHICLSITQLVIARWRIKNLYQVEQFQWITCTCCLHMSKRNKVLFTRNLKKAISHKDVELRYYVVSSSRYKILENFPTGKHQDLYDVLQPGKLP